jgi:aminopeptidase N
MRIATGLLLLACLSPACAGDKQDPIDERAVDVLHYDVALNLDFDRSALTATTKIEFLARRPTSEIWFSGTGLSLDKVSLAGRVLQFDNDGSRLTIRFPRALEQGERAVITVQYHGETRRGLVFDRRLAYTNYWACDWMICALDDTGDKASIRLALELPKDSSSYGPGRLISRTTLANGRTRQVWSERRPYSAYLFGFVAGDFAVAKQRYRSTELLYFGSGVSESELRNSFAPTADMVKFFEQKAGVDIPQRRYAQLLVPGDVAQEAVNFSLIGAELVRARLDDPQEDWVIAHELAHQWWGNAITCADLSQFWLNEGITVFMTAAWKESRWGRDAYDREMQLLRQRVETAKAAGVDRKLTSRESYPSLPLRRAIQYSKGALFMDRLREELGDELFWRAFKAYTRTYIGKIVTSRDLQRTFEETGRRDLSRLFEEWVYDPSVSAHSRPDAGRR